MKILVFGNPQLQEDALALRVSQKITLEGVKFVHSENLNDLLEEDYDAILDVAYGIPRVVQLNDLEKLREHKLVSLHDYDVAFFLKLMKAMGKLDKVKIIAMPINYDIDKAAKEVKKIISSLF